MTRKQHCEVWQPFMVAEGWSYLPKSLNHLDENDKLVSRSLTVHAEAAAIEAATFDLNGATLYTYPRFPCSDCALRIVQAGITQVIAPAPTDGYWKADQELAIRIFKRAGIDVKFAGRLSA